MFLKIAFLFMMKDNHDTNAYGINGGRKGATCWGKHDL